MKSIIFLVLVAQAFAGPTTKPAQPPYLTSKPPESRPTTKQVPQVPSLAPTKTGQPPYISSKPPENRPTTKQVPTVPSSAPPKTAGQTLHSTTSKPESHSTTPRKVPEVSSAAPPKTGGPLALKTSHPPPIDHVHLPSTVLPPRDITSKPPSPGSQPMTHKVTEVSHPAPPKASNPPFTNGPKPSGSPSTFGKPPSVGTSQGIPGQVTKLRYKRHLKGSQSHPTGAPHQTHNHAHQSHASQLPKVTHPAGGAHKEHGEGQKPQPFHGK
ncbi:uncharacterized protein RB166_018477 isoform 2-T2 [Leptodactylus fuscus]|uniref:uncharacterized protein LOC142182816 isoform X2 n=1 Tax=Leptodactylus fuscus TaxID=238119 RepID=UPI003F4ED37A